MKFAIILGLGLMAINLALVWLFKNTRNSCPGGLYHYQNTCKTEHGVETKIVDGITIQRKVYKYCCGICNLSWRGHGDWGQQK